MSVTGKQNIAKASQVVRARERLEKAVVRLDQAYSEMPETSAGGNSGQLAKDMAALKAENSKLRETTLTISGRLDQAIGRLKTVLES